MAKIEQILNRCSAEELRFAAEWNKLSRSGSKGDLISRLMLLPPKKILEGISNKQLQSILEAYELPKSGNKGELVNRVLSLLKTPKGKAMRPVKAPAHETLTAEEKKVAFKKGHDFERQVAAWAQKEFNATSIETNTLVNGLSVARPYEVDVHVQYKRKGLFARTSDLWVECKDRRSSIKRKDVSDLVNKARDVCEASKVGRMKFYFDRLAVVSTSEFDSDALAYANQTGVLCIHFDGKKFIRKNNPDFEEDPIWLTRARGY